MGTRIAMESTGINVLDNPIIPFIAGDGTGPDIRAASVQKFSGIPSPVKNPELIDADLIGRGLTEAIQKKCVTYDFALLMDDATKVSTSEFGDRIVQNVVV